MPQQGMSSSGASRAQESDDTFSTPHAPQVSTSGVDDLLEEIDSLLEENAEAFVKSFVQKGGQ
jgi:ubiquitin-like protein Pup